MWFGVLECECPLELWHAGWGGEGQMLWRPTFLLPIQGIHPSRALNPSLAILSVLWGEIKSLTHSLDRRRVVAPSKTCGHAQSSRHCSICCIHCTLGRVILVGVSTPVYCRVCNWLGCPRPGVARSGLVSLLWVGVHGQRQRVTSGESWMPWLLRQFDFWQRRSWWSGSSRLLGSVTGSSCGTPPVIVRQPSSESRSLNRIREDRDD